MMHIQHLPDDLLGKILAGYRQLSALDFDQEDERLFVLIWVNTATEYLQSYSREDFESNEQVNILVDAIGEVLIRLNEYSPPTLPPSP